MREIKFRGKPIEYPIRVIVDNEPRMPFVYGGYYKDDCWGNKNGEKEYIIQYNSTGLGYNEFIRVDPETVGQYTGLRDRDGKEIYEGDIITITLDTGDVITGSIGMNNGQWSIKYYDRYYSLVSIWHEMKPKVIGNICENREVK